MTDARLGTAMNACFGYRWMGFKHCLDFFWKKFESGDIQLRRFPPHEDERIVS